MTRSNFKRPKRVNHQIKIYTVNDSFRLFNLKIYFAKKKLFWNLKIHLKSWIRLNSQSKLANILECEFPSYSFYSVGVCDAIRYAYTESLSLTTNGNISCTRVASGDDFLWIDYADRREGREKNQISIDVRAKSANGRLSRDILRKSFSASLFSDNAVCS